LFAKVRVCLMLVSISVVIGRQRCTHAKCKGFGTGDAAPQSIECSRPLQ
jgi:hypothetical protein